MRPYKQTDLVLPLQCLKSCSFMSESSLWLMVEIKSGFRESFFDEAPHRAWFYLNTEQNTENILVQIQAIDGRQKGPGFKASVWLVLWPVQVYLSPCGSSDCELIRMGGKKWMDRWMDTWIDGRMDVWMDRWMDGQMVACLVSDCVIWGILTQWHGDGFC